MPKIKIYRNGSTIIPVDGTKIQTGYQCKKTGYLFTSKIKYVTHLKQRRQKIHIKNQEERRRARRTQRFEEFKDSGSFENMIVWIEANPDYFIDSVRYLCHIPEEFVDKFEIKILKLRLAYSDIISNTHSCPSGGVTNWDRVSNKPKGYPGWRGHIRYNVQLKSGVTLPKTSDYPGFYIFKNTLIHTGTGGGRSLQDYGFDVSIFLQDLALSWQEKIKISRAEKILMDAGSYGTNTRYLDFEYSHS